MGPLGPYRRHLATATVENADAAIVLLKRLRKEHNAANRRALITAVEQLIQAIRQREDNAQEDRNG